MRTAMRVAAMIAVAAGMGAAAGPEKFSGTWEASAKGKVFLVLKVKAGEKITGTLNAGSIAMNQEGDLQDVGPVEDHEAPIFFAKLEGETLTFNFQDDDDDVLKFELKLTGDGAGELKIIDEHFPKLKPFAVKRVKQG